LQAANGGTTKTKIMYKAYLSYAQLREYLTVLVENELLEFDQKNQTYKTSEKGFRFLKLHEQMGRLGLQEAKLSQLPRM
jgi:predicted transcriptional regulator